MRAVDDNQEQTVPSITKGLRIATRCVTVEQFVESYHQICEDSAIFIPNTQRPVKTVLQFRFDLQDGNPALLGIGTVVEELTTKYNRFDHVGIVVELQRLSRASTVTFDEMLARARSKLAIPVPIYPRAMTVPIAVIRDKTVRQVPIPAPTAITKSKPVVGSPKKPTETVRIPAIIAPPKKQSVVAPPAVVVAPVVVQRAEPPAPAVVTPPSSIDDGWDSIASEPEPTPPAEPVAPALIVESALAPIDPVATVVLVESALAIAPVATTSIVEDSLASRDIDIELDVPAVVAAEPDPFESITAVESPDAFLLALIRRDDGRAVPVSIEAAVDPSPALAEPVQPIVEDPWMPAMIFAPPAIELAPQPIAPAAIEASIDHPVPIVRRPWRWIAAAGAFAVLLCVIAATVLVDRPAAALPPSTFAPEAPLESSAVVTAREQAPPVVDPKPMAPKPRARPISVERPAPRPVARPLYRPAAPKKKCRNLGCL